MDIVGAYGARYSGKYKNAVAAHHRSSVSSVDARLQTSRITVPIRSPTCEPQMVRSARYTPNLDYR